MPASDKHRDVLIVEDDLATAELERRALRRAGRNSVMVHLVSDAMSHINTSKYAAVLLDYRLPDGESWPVLDAATSLQPRIPVILATAMGDERVAAEAIHRGADDYLIKSDRFWETIPTVVDRVVKLADAEEALRRSEAMQGAILNALPAHIALLDRGGHVVAINRFWRAFADVNNSFPDFDTAEMHYTEAYSRFLDAHSEMPPAAAKGIDAVLSGARPHYSVEYPFNAAGRRHWFRLEAHPVEKSTDVDGAVVMQVDITDRKLAEEETQRRLEQQAAVASLSRWALREDDQDRLLQRAAEFAARTLRAEFGAVWVYERETSQLTLSAGHGWRAGTTEGVAIEASEQFQSGYTLLTSSPAVIEDFDEEPRFQRHPLVESHGVVSSVTVVIHGGRHPFGVLGAYTVEQRKFTPDDAHFLQSLANVLGTALERKQAEAALQRQTNILENILNSVEDGIGVVDTQGRVLAVNRACREIVRMHGDEPTLDNWTNFFGLRDPATRAPIPPEDLPLIRAMRGEQIHDAELLLTWNDDTPDRLINVTGTPLRDKDDAIMGGVAVVRDITERRQQEAVKQQLATAVEQTADAVVITDRNMMITYVNPSFERITGFTASEMIGQSLESLRSPETPATMYAEMQETLRNAQTWKGHLLNRTKSGTAYEADVTISPLRDARGELTHFVSTQRDVTEQRRLEEQLLHSQKMEAIGQLAGGLAHDFNNLLTAIKGYAEILLNATGEESWRRADLDEICRAADSATALTRQLLTFARRQVIRPELLRLNDVILHVEKMLRRLIAEHIQLELELDSGIGSIQADRGQMEQILINLAVNARDAMPNGGTLIIQTSNVDVADGSAECQRSVPKGSYVRLTVRDSGSGMDATVRERIFEPFFTTKPQGQGTGLGLATVYGITRQNDGHILVDSAPGQGSVFHVYMPRRSGSVRTSTATRDTSASRGGNERILVVEDNDMIRGLLSRVLRAHGYEANVVGGPLEALELARNCAEPIHLILTDVVMPEISGPALAEQLLAIHSNAKVILMSGYTDETIMQQPSWKAGIPFLQKPFTPNELLRRIRQVLDEG